MKFRIESLILFVQNIELLKNFYTQVFEFEALEEIPKQWVLLKAGSCNMGLHQIGEAYMHLDPASAASESNTKIVFEVDEDLFSLRTDLLSRGVRLKETQEWEGYDYIICDGEDPEGNLFQLKQRISGI